MEDLPVSQRSEDNIPIGDVPLANAKTSSSMQAFSLYMHKWRLLKLSHLLPWPFSVREFIFSWRLWSGNNHRFLALYRTVSSKVLQDQIQHRESSALFKAAEILKTKQELLQSCFSDTRLSKSQVSEGKSSLNLTKPISLPHHRDTLNLQKSTASSWPVVNAPVIPGTDGSPVSKHRTEISPSDFATSASSTVSPRYLSIILRVDETSLMLNYMSASASKMCQALLFPLRAIAHRNHCIMICAGWRLYGGGQAGP